MPAAGHCCAPTAARGVRPPVSATAIAAVLDHALVDAGAVLVSDYGRGVAADPAVRAALARAVRRRVPVVWDPHPRGADPVPGVSVVTPNLGEARRAAGIDAPGSGVGAALALGAHLVERWDVRAVAVTLGARGAAVRHRHGACAAAPAPAVTETDPCGAGDHFAGGVAARLAAGATVDEAVADAVVGAAGFVARGGGAAVRRVGDAWCQPERAVLGRTTPVTGLDAARALVARVRSAGGTVVATGGVFDPLHRGHTDSLAAARALGDCLLVLVNSDGSARRRSGAAAPLAERLAALAALDGVDGVVPFEADDPRAVLDALRPDLWAKGGDHDPADLPETPLVRSWGGEVVAVPYRATAETNAGGAAATLIARSPAAGRRGRRAPPCRGCGGAEGVRCRFCQTAPWSSMIATPRSRAASGSWGSRLWRVWVTPSCSRSACGVQRHAGRRVRPGAVVRCGRRASRPGHGEHDGEHDGDGGGPPGTGAAGRGHGGSDRRRPGGAPIRGRGTPAVSRANEPVSAR